jgi:NADPH:quinone reductase-like Zn-dependent oxidoreductase
VCGDQVAAAWIRLNASYAEYVTVPITEIAGSRQRSRAEAAASNGCRRRGAFISAAADVQRGERVLVQGGAGGTGSADRKSLARGAYIATASNPRIASIQRPAPTK